MRVALAQINTSMGALEGNCRRISRFLERSRALNADVIVFPELTVVGYPPRDHVEQEGFVHQSWSMVEKLATQHPDQAFIVGAIQPYNDRGKGRFNTAVFISNGKIQHIHAKSLLPSYDIFDETRYFDESKGVETFLVGKTRVGITICEDIWAEEMVMGRNFYLRHPARDLKKKGANLILNLSASPFHENKEKVRLKIAETLVKELGLPFVYVNLVGGNDEIIFDGGSFAVNEKGKIIARCKVFEEDLVLADFSQAQAVPSLWPDTVQEWKAKALIMGVRDYVRKCGFAKVVIGLSGGIDSALTAVIAAKALGPENVMGISMPSKFTSQASREDAEELARRMGIVFHTIPIDSIAGQFEDSLRDIFEGRERDVTEENIQARVRGNLLMAISNKFGSLVLSTGNKSELAVGYCTQYGDMAGGLAVISDLPKQEVYRVARYLNEETNWIPERIFEKKPSAELRPNQTDQDSLPPYPVLDGVLQLYIEEMKSFESIVSQGFDRDIVKQVIEMVDRNEFKRRQAPPGLKLTTKAFGSGRRMPIARGSL